MIRTWYWGRRAAIPRTSDYETIPGAERLEDAIHKFPDDYHFFIIVTGHLTTFHQWVKDNKLHIYYQSKETNNWRYPPPDYGPRLTAFILTTKPKEQMQ